MADIHMDMAGDGSAWAPPPSSLLPMTLQMNVHKNIQVNALTQ